MSKRGRLGSVALVAGVAVVAVPTLGHATLLDYQLTVSGAAGDLPESFSTDSITGTANTGFSLSVTVPTQTTANPGDTLEIDLLAPAGLQFVFTTPASAIFNSLELIVRDAGLAGGATAFGNTTVMGQGGTGTISQAPAGTGLFVVGNQFSAVATFSITGTVSFTELSVQFVIPAGVTFPLTANSESANDEVVVNGSTDPGAIVSLEAIPAAVPEPTALALLCSALAGLGLIRRRKRV